MLALRADTAKETLYGIYDRTTCPGAGAAGTAGGECGENATWSFYENGELVISGSGAIPNYASQKEQPWASVRHLVKKIKIGKDITAIGNYAFAYCEYTSEIEFEEGSQLERI